MILVTGGAGFIGSVLVKQLNLMGRTDIVIVDRVRDSLKWKNLRGLKYDRYIHSDALFAKENETLFAQLEAIFHMGACSATTELNMDYLYNNNVEFSKRLFDISAKFDLSFVYASSAATYGAGELGYSDDPELLPKLMPLNRYGYSKQLFDEWVLKQAIRPSLWFGLKFFNVYGPNEYHKGSMRSIVHKSFEQIRDCGKVNLFKSHKEGFKDGEQLRDFVYGVDVAKAMIRLAFDAKEKSSGIYNMGTGIARSFKDLTLATFKSMGIAPNIDYIDMPEELRGQYQYFTQAKMDRFSALFPDFSFLTLEEGVDDYVKNYLLQENAHC